MARDSVDVVILSWKRVQMTLEAVRSVLDQRSVEPVVWVLDQGSGVSDTARLEAALTPLAQVHYIQLGRNLGVAEGRNRGIDHGSAPVVVCLDNDAVFNDANALCHVFERFDADDRLGALGFRIVDAATGELDRRSWVYPRSRLAQNEAGFVTTRFCGAGHALRREAFSRSGGYDPSLFFYWEEVDLSNRMIQEGYTIEYDPAVIVLHKRDEEGRYHWKDDRFYYLVRNALYLEWKFYRSPVRLAMMAVGYLAKGIYNGLAGQALRGLLAALPRIWHLVPPSQPLGMSARAYIRQHETRYRGGLWTRLRHEVLEKLPS